MKIYAKSKEWVQDNIEAITNDDDIVVISIRGTGDPQIMARAYRCLPLEFDDLRPSTVGNASGFESDFIASVKDCKAMTHAEAMLLHYFIEVMPKTTHTVIVHCSAGISRSGAVARYLSETLDVDAERFAADNKQIQPNPWVYDLLWSTHAERLLWDKDDAPE